MSISRVLVTGGAGFIGSHLVDALIGKGIRKECAVTILDDLSTGSASNLGDGLKSSRVRFVEGDVRDRVLVEEAMKRVETVFHLAAVTSVPYSVKHPEETFEVNVDGTRNLLEASLHGDVDRFVYVSTCAVYGEPRYLPVDEKHPLRPISPYAESKLRAEEACMEFQRAQGLKITVLRPFNVYGSRQRRDQYGGVISQFIERIRDGKPPVIFGDGSQTRDFVYVSDVLKAFILAVESEVAVGRVFNVASGVPTSISDLARLVIDLCGVRDVEPVHAGERQGDIRNSYADINEARTCLGFEPQVSLREGLSTLI